MIIPFSSKILQKVKELFFEDEKMLFIVNSSFAVAFFFGRWGSRHDSIGNTVRIWGKERVDAHFTFEVDAFLGVERLGEVKYDAFNSLFKWG